MPLRVDEAVGQLTLTTGSPPSRGSIPSAMRMASSMSVSTIIDSGTTLMYGPPAAVKTFYAAISGSAVFDSSEGLYSFPCDSVPTVGFSWGGKTWQMSQEK